MPPAVVLREIGPPSVLKVEEKEQNTRAPSEVLVTAVSSSVNPVDFKTRGGGIPTSVPRILGGDVAGVVAEGDENGKFKAGDRVIALTDGFRWDSDNTFSHGTYQQYVSVPPEWLAHVPDTVALDTAGGIPLVALTAWQALATADLKAGQRVLVHAGAGGVGHFAVQLARVHWGAHVTATAGPANQGFLKELGVDEPLDYTQPGYLDKFTEEPFHGIVDVIGGDAEVASYKVLAPGGTYAHIFNTGTSQERIAAGKAWTDKKYSTTLVEPNGEQLQQVLDYIAAGKIQFAVEKVFPLSEVAAAHELAEGGHVRGKVVLSIP